MANIRLIRRAVLGAVLLTLSAGVAAPFINADRFGVRIREALERSLRRKVEIGRVHFNLFTGPGFTIDDVLIYEDPRFGAELFAHVAQLDTRVGLGSILTGRLSFSRLRLLEPSVNLVRRSEGGWNVVALFEQTGKPNTAGQPGPALGVPAIEVRSGRLYFKRDETKSAFYLTDTDVDLSPRGGGRDGFDIRFTAGPARTDRTAQAFATLRGSGRWQPRPGAEPALDLDLELERAGMDEIVTLIRGENFGFHGALTSRAKLSGPLSAIDVAGQMRIDDVHRWDLMPRGGGWNFKYAGRIDWRNQTAVVELTEKDNPGLAVLGSVRLDSFLSQPAWSGQMQTKSLPAANVIEFARHLGASIPANLNLTGNLNGGASFSNATGWQGSLVLDESDVSMAKDVRLRVARTEIVLAQGKVLVGPTAVTGEEGESAGLEAVYDLAAGALDLNLRARLLSIAEMQSESGHLLTAAAVPLLEGLQHGRWSGALRYQIRNGEAGIWTGSIELRDVQAAIPGVADPVRLRSATVQIAGERIQVSRMRARAGALDIGGDYRYQPGDKHPHQFNLLIPEASAPEIERLLLPSLRREQGFLARTLRFKPSPPPGWIKDRHAEGVVRIGLLSGGPVELHGLRANVTWDGPLLTVAAREAKTLDGSLRAVMTVDVAGSLPAYHIEGKVREATWSEGKVDLEGALDTKGTGLEWLANLRAKGSFQGRTLAVLPENPVRTASGDFELAIAASGPLLTLTDLQAAVGADSFTGQGATLADGTLRLDLASAHGNSMQFVGPLAPLRLELAQSKP